MHAPPAAVAISTMRRGGSGAGQRDLEGSGLGKLLSPARRRQAVRHAQTALDVAERRACRVLRQARSTQRYPARAAPDEPALVARIVALAQRFGRYGYRRITALLRAEGWRVNHKRVARLWRREGLRVPPKPPRRRRLWLADGTTTRRRATRPHHVWAYDFVQDRTHDGRPLRLLCIVDEYTRECLAIVVARRLRADDVLACLTQLFVERGPPASLRSDNGPEFTAHAVRAWLPRVGVTTLFIHPGSPWGERLCRVLQRQTARRVPQRGDLHHPGRGPSPQRTLAAGIQPAAAPQRPRLPAPRPTHAPGRVAGGRIGLLEGGR